MTKKEFEKLPREDRDQIVSDFAQEMKDQDMQPTLPQFRNYLEGLDYSSPNVTVIDSIIH